MLITISIILIGLFCLTAIWLLWSQWSRSSEKLHFVLTELNKAKEHELQLQDDITAMQMKLKQSEEDVVTQLPSWRLFEDRLQQGIKESERYQLVLGLLIVDIDQFRLVNDMTDYKTGDLVLQEVARRLQRCIRQVDSVSRFNKDTFVVMISRLSKPETAAIVAQRILQSLIQPFELKNESLRLTASIGIATYSQDGKDGASLMLAADHALKVAKSKGMHRYEYFQEDMYHRSRRTLLLSSALNSASVMQDFTLRYQPIIDTSTNDIVCMDTLLSWGHTELGDIGSEELLKLAEHQQKLPMVIEWMFTTACQQFVRWRMLEFKPAMLGVSVPVSLLQNSAFVCRLSQIMKDSQFDPSWLLLQVKASPKPISFDVLEKSFNMLRYLNVKFAIDDFGSGGLSLWQLKQFPVSYFKLDKVLMSDIDSNPHTGVLIKSTLELAKNLGVQLIVQGVETETQLRLLKEAGCVLMEGSVLGAPHSRGEVVPME